MMALGIAIDTHDGMVYIYGETHKELGEKIARDYLLKANLKTPTSTIDKKVKEHMYNYIYGVMDE